MRILVANSFYAPQVVGGAELSVQGIAEELVRLGNQVSVFTTGEHDADEQLNGVDIARRRLSALMPYGVHRNSRTSLVKVANKPLTIDNPFNRHAIQDVLKTRSPQVVLSNNLMGITPQLWRSAAQDRIPVMHTVRDFSLLCPNSVLSCSHDASCPERPLPHCKIMRKHLCKQSGLVATVAAPSRYPLEVHDRLGFFSGARHCVIPNAVRFDPSKVEAAVSQRKTSTPHGGALKVVYLGRLVEEKGVTDLLEAVEMLGASQVELHLAGSGPLEPLLERKSNEGVPLVLHGFLNQTEVDRLLMECDVLVAPSRVAETFGRVVLDAWRNAMPAIVTNVGAFPEVLVPQTGTVVPACDSKALGQALGAYRKDRARIVEEGSLGAKRLEEYSVSRQALRFLKEMEMLT